MLLGSVVRQTRRVVSVGIQGVVPLTFRSLNTSHDCAGDRDVWRRVFAPSMTLKRSFAHEVQRSNSGASGLVETGGGLGGTSGVSKRTDRKCTLVLEDGSVFSGQSFGSEVRPMFEGWYLALHLLPELV
jgi:hypothetical protein